MTRRSKTKIRSLKRAPRHPIGGRSQVDEQRGSIQLETLGKVAAVLSHESRNLLGALGTCVQILRRNSNLTADDLELLDIMQSGADRLSEVVAQFAIFRHPVPSQLSEVSLHNILEEILARLHQDERCSAEIVIGRRFDSNIKFIKADAEVLRRVFWELCLNGVQAMGQQGTLEVETHCAAGNVLITIRDNGPGIESSLAKDIFEPLFTTRTRATGLGLAIVRLIVEEHGGTVELKSVPGKGASFTVTLPSSGKLNQKPNAPIHTHARSKHDS